MSQFQKKSYLKRVMYSPITLVLLGVVVVLAIYGVIDIIPKYIDAARAERTIENKKELLAERHARLEEELENMKTPEGIEENIREKLNVVKEGEHVIMIVEPKVQAVDESTQTKKSWWQRLFEK